MWVKRSYERRGHVCNNDIVMVDRYYTNRRSIFYIYIFLYHGYKTLYFLSILLYIYKSNIINFDSVISNGPVWGCNAKKTHTYCGGRRKQHIAAWKLKTSFVSAAAAAASSSDSIINHLTQPLDVCNPPFLVDVGGEQQTKMQQMNAAFD